MNQDRTIYVGQYVDGLREGQGTRTLFDGSKFVGIWKDNRRWKGKSFDEEGKEIGEYVNGEEEIYYKHPSKINLPHFIRHYHHNRKPIRHFI